MAPGSIPERFAERAALVPHEIAVVCGEQRLTYAELDRRANGIARRLLDLGVLPEEPVAILMERSVHLAVVVIGVLKAGAAYLPLHSGNPVKRHEMVTRQAGARVLIADTALRAHAPADGLTVLDPAGVTPGTDPHIDTPAHALAYVMYTSGSTGTPKGIAVTHQDVLALVDDSLWQGRRHERVLMLAPYAFDVSTYELWVPLLHGGLLVMAPEPFDVDTLRRLLKDHRITGLQLTAGLFRVVADEAPDCFTGVREVMTGGDVISPTAVARVLDACPGTLVRAMYGPTETTLFATHHPMTEAPRGSVPLGRPLDGMAAYVLDNGLVHTPVGEAGELYLAGAGVARGYLGRSGRTAEHFLADPYGPRGTRMYRTGDLARLNADGELEFLGRAGNQVKVRGFRIELGEIETALAALVPDAPVVVTARGEDANDRRLVAYLVPGPDKALPTAGELSRQLAETLPDYMVPSAFVVLDALPLTVNGKVDHRALPAPGTGADDVAGAPRDAVEQHLVRLFVQVLKTESVGIRDDFFELGGTSLGATRLLSRIRAELGVRLSVRDLMNLRTVAALAASLPRARLPEKRRTDGGKHQTAADSKDRDAGSEALRPLLTLRAHGSRTPVFCVHPGGGMAWCYTGLLRHLPNDVPVYALQARGLTGTEPVARSMDEMVGDYLDQIRRIQPTGPYRLIGWSFGGNAAQSMAARLRTQGAEVSLLAVLDAGHGGARDHSVPRPPRHVLHVAFDGLAAFDAETGDGPLDAHRIQQILQEHDSPLADVGTDVIDAIVAVTANNIRVSDDDRPRHFDGDMLFFESTDRTGAPTGLADVWRPHIGGRIERRIVGFDHMRLMTREALDVIGPVLARRLGS
ncbi:amino acid adenylation domain-containing protein [Streptomyces sp. NPDC048611]|uniref:amino acid adenylation domain-containing protein n=1 Tax=Streptomyces sp. NPDC048611 TaxID=3155635 RepID=UPI00341787B6